MKLYHSLHSSNDFEGQAMHYYILLSGLCDAFIFEIRSEIQSSFVVS